MAAEELDALVLNLYRLARNESPAQFQSAALELVKPVLDFDSGWWGTVQVTGSPEAVSDVAVSAVHLHDIPPDLAVEYEAFKHQDVCAATLLAHGSGIYRFHAPTDTAGKERSGIRDLHRRYGTQNTLLSAEFTPRNGVTSFASLFRRDPDATYSARDVAALRILWPHLLEALTISRMLRLEHLGLDGLRHPLAISDLQGLLLHRDEAFVDLLRTEFLSPPADQLPVRVLDGLLGAGCYVGRAIVVVGRVDAGMLMLKARVRRAVDGLSAREREIAGLFASGHDHKAIAAALHISPGTVRTHLKNVYRKLDVGDRVKLMHELALAGPTPMAPRVAARD